VTVSPRKKRIPWWKQLSNHERKSKPGGSPPKPNNKNRKEDHMKSIKRAIRLIAVQRGLSTSVALGADPVAGREEHPITRSRPRRWTAVLALVIALLPGTAPAQEADTLTISGTFSMDYLNSESDLNWFVPDLVEVYANGHEHTWTLTLHGTTNSSQCSHEVCSWCQVAEKVPTLRVRPVQGAAQKAMPAKETTLSQPSYKHTRHWYSALVSDDSLD
jgi:hypothetical protein